MIFRLLSSLSLINNKNLVDISPLSALGNLLQLDLDGNVISDLSPLSELNVTDLRVCGNEISDITPLGKLKKIERLSISYNPIKDISALRNVTTLLQLNAVVCPIEDFSPVDHVENVESWERNGQVSTYEIKDGTDSWSAY